MTISSNSTRKLSGNHGLDFYRIRKELAFIRLRLCRDFLPTQYHPHNIYFRTLLPVSSRRHQKDVQCQHLTSHLWRDMVILGTLARLWKGKMIERCFKVLANEGPGPEASMTPVEVSVEIRNESGLLHTK